MSNNSKRFGFVALVGRPNVGKSTMINYFLEKKISITSKKPQTTRDRILGIKTKGNVQIAYVDTPGLISEKKSVGRKELSRAAKIIFQDVDVTLFVVDSKEWGEEEEWILAQLREINSPVILVVNKIDRLSNRKLLLPLLAAVKDRFNFHAIVPVSAKQGDQLEYLEQEVIRCLPCAEHVFSETQLTDRSDLFMVAEILREKLMRCLGEELPYSVTVEIVLFEESEKLIKISAVIWVVKKSQKAILIGKQGERMKTIATKARKSMERYFSRKVFLQTWVKVGSSKKEAASTSGE